MFKNSIKKLLPRGNECDYDDAVEGAGEHLYSYKLRLDLISSAVQFLTFNLFIAYALE